MLVRSNRSISQRSSSGSVRRATMAPVSYTHLDVYKRQVVALSLFDSARGDKLRVDGLGAELERPEQVLDLPEVENVFGDVFPPASCTSSALCAGFSPCTASLALASLPSHCCLKDRSWPSSCSSARCWAWCSCWRPARTAPAPYLSLIHIFRPKTSSQASVRLACVKHAASVRPEPGSNSC